MWGDFMQAALGEIVDRMGMTWRDLAAQMRHDFLEGSESVCVRA